MLRLARADLRQFRSMWRRCHTTTRPPRLPAFEVSSRQGKLAFLATHPHGQLGYVSQQPGCGSGHTLPGDLLELAEQTTTNEFVLERREQEWHGTWTEPSGDGARSWPIPEMPVGTWPEPVDVWSSTSGTLLAALGTAGEVASTHPGRWATHRIQIQGQTGRVIATDTKQMLVQEGFRFPFSDTILIPALPVFHAPPWRQAAVQTALCGETILLRIGHWLLTLRLDATGHFPDCIRLVPRAANPSRAALSEADVRSLLAYLMPDGKAESSTVTLKLQPGELAVRSRVAEVLSPTLRLHHAAITGPALQVTVDAKYLTWGLQRSFRTLQLVAPENPLLMADSHRQFVVATLPVSEAVPCEPQTSSFSKALSSTVDPSLPVTPVEVSISQVRLSASPTQPEVVADALDEAEAIRQLVHEAHARLTQLVQQLKSKRKTERAFTQVMRSIQALPLPERL